MFPRLASLQLCSWRGCYHSRLKSAQAQRFLSHQQPTDNINITHSQFLAEASSSANWKQKMGSNGASPDFDDIPEGKSKLLPTSSHLFKLVLSLDKLRGARNGTSNSKSKSTPPTVILLHPSQPLSHVARLILPSIRPQTPEISFQSVFNSGRTYRWSDSTDVGDFIKNAAHSSQFSICFTYDSPPDHRESLTSEGTAEVGETNEDRTDEGEHETIIDVEIPTFADRTRFLRRRLNDIEKQLHSMEKLKMECDHEAHRGAKRVAIGGFGMLLVYWGAVARLTFWDFGWDVMEPITYLSGLSTVICGYLWFLYQGREVSYSSVLDRSISTRRQALYKARGLDIEQWMELKGEARSLKKEISYIAADYDVDGEAKTREKDQENQEARNERNLE